MIESTPPSMMTIIVFGTGILLFGYIAFRLVTATQSNQTTIRTDVTTAHSYKTPEDWDGETPLCLCDECGAFNHVEYRYCRGCATAVQQSRMLPPRSVSELKGETENKH